MAEKKKFLLRISDNVYAALEKWASDDLRSINAQIEYLLISSLKSSGRLIKSDGKEPSDNPTNPFNNQEN